jgi:hypothetical protein
MLSGLCLLQESLKRIAAFETGNQVTFPRTQTKPGRQALSFYPWVSALKITMSLLL